MKAKFAARPGKRYKCLKNKDINRCLSIVFYNQISIRPILTVAIIGVYLCCFICNCTEKHPSNGNTSVPEWLQSEKVVMFSNLQNKELIKIETNISFTFYFKISDAFTLTEIENNRKSIMLALNKYCVERGVTILKEVNRSNSTIVKDINKSLNKYYFEDVYIEHLSFSENI